MKTISNQKAVLGLISALALLGPLPDVHAITFSTNTTIAAGDSTYEGQDVVVRNCTLTVDGPHTFASLSLQDEGILTHSAYSSGENAQLGLDLTVTGDVLVDVSSRVDANGRGYACINGVSHGPGAGTGTRSDSGGGGGGGAYGGNGGVPESPYLGGHAHGSPTEPNQHGSSGGAGRAGQGGAGGGLVRFVVSGSFQLDGQISANGLNGSYHSYGASGGGAGGSLWLQLGAFSGSGSLSANGGGSYVVSEEDGGGGGGGRIAVHCKEFTFTGAMTSRGAASGNIAARSGGAGTVFLKSDATHQGQLVIENGETEGGITPWIQPAYLSSLTVRSRAIVEIPGEGLMEVPEQIVVGNLGTLLCRSSNIDSLVAETWQGTGATIRSAILRVESGGLITASGQGYLGTTSKGNGPGSGSGTRIDSDGGGGGGAHGGNGGNPGSSFAGGFAYGSITEPIALGSAGGAGLAGNGGAGGGAVRIIADSLEMEGQLAADGLSGSFHSYGASGGGAGGSLWLQLGAFSGSGSLSANGGGSYVVSEEDGGGGGGGRIAIEWRTHTFTGEIQAYGGISGNDVSQGQTGGAGTIYLKSDVQTSGNLIVDNRQVLGALTPWPATVALDEITIRRGGSLELAGESLWNGSALLVGDGGVVHLREAAEFRLNSLTMTSNSRVYCHGQHTTGMVAGRWAGRGVTLEAQTAQIGTGATITADGLGYTGTSTMGNGPGAGNGSRSDEPDGGGSGAAYGGNGGPAEGPWLPGSSYGSVAHPIDLGSAGGAGLAGPGANGGGAVCLIVSGACSLDGMITARGLNGAVHSYGAAGGGAGGSVWISAGSLSGTGGVDVRGGEGAIVSEEDSGGGGGGRIAIDAVVNDFAGGLLAQGGGGLRGGAGTIYRRTSPQSVGNLLVDNGGMAGVRTSLTGNEKFDQVRVQNQGVLELLPGQAFSAAIITAAADGILVPQGGAVIMAEQLLVEQGGEVRCESANDSGMVAGAWAGYGVEFLLNSLDVQAGGVLTATGQGYTGTDGLGNGPGGGSGTRNDPNGGGGGGGHGGAGGPGEWQQPGGETYGSKTQPVTLGSAGGAGKAGRGGNGGGAIRVIATNQVVVNGLISSNGNPGLSHPYGASGGGAGGSIWITARSLSGTTGSILAVGGQGWGVLEEDSGGGGGGIIALDVINQSFSGTVSAAGALGGYYGGNGSVTTSPAVPCVVSPSGGAVAGNVVEFTLKFAEPVTGFTQEDMVVTHGTKGHFTGSGSTYTLSVSSMGGVVTCLVPAAVADSDGVPNAQSNQGFAYVTPADLPQIEMLRSPGALQLSWSSVVGLNYQLESSTNLAPDSWVNEGPSQQGTGDRLFSNIIIGEKPSQFFRMQIHD